MQIDILYISQVNHRNTVVSNVAFLMKKCNIHFQHVELDKVPDPE